MRRFLFQEGGITKMTGIMNAKGHMYNAKVIKYTAHVLNTMYKHRSLHETVQTTRIQGE